MTDPMILAQQIDAALRSAGVPILGVTVGTEDPATWRVRYAAEATAAQQAQGDALLRTALSDADVDGDDRTADLLAALIDQWDTVSALVSAGKKVQALSRVKAALRNGRRARHGV